MEEKRMNIKSGKNRIKEERNGYRKKEKTNAKNRSRMKQKKRKIKMAHAWVKVE
jgi:hypothetical protein